MSDLPAELVAKPLALIALSGLDTSNTMHRSVWDAFSNNRRPDGAAVQFKLLASNHEFPTAKPKRNSYEWYIPKGILKRNWMNKYLNEVPSIVVYFYDLDWGDPMWNEKKMECASKIQALRASLEGRNTKIAVVLIQKIAPPPGSEDAIATQRATALCTACELPAKSLYVLPHGDHLLGYTSRLETAFYEWAQNFYYHQYRIVKGHRDQLNKSSHQYLFIRHQFKMGFFNELKQDKYTALKHYQHAYNNLLEVRMMDTNTFEIKTVASFINYKLCRLMFILNQPRDAISQFRAHTDRFRSRTGPEKLLFEHHAWMSNQYSMFAELFDEAIRQGLPPVQTQHPGYYFQLAADHAGLRQASFKELCDNIQEPSAFGDLSTDETKLEFYGQRCWKSEKLSSDPTDAAREMIGIQTLKYRESTVNHSMIIIGLLGNAISQFKIYRCPRMRRLLVVQMAAEYYNARDYGKVLTLLMHMLWEYRTERWPVLLTDILKNALRAAFLSTSIQDYVTLAVEALGPFTAFSLEHRATIFSNIVSILQRRSPQPEPDLPDDAKAFAIEKWATELNRSDKFTFIIDDTNMSSFINVKTRFSSCKYVVGQSVIIEIFVRNLYEGEIEFSKIIVTVGITGCNSDFAVTETSIMNFKFIPNEIKKFICEFPAPQQSDGKEIQIIAVSLYLGNDENCIIMRFSAVGGDLMVLDRFYPEIQQLRGGKFEAIRPLITAEIKQEESNLILTTNSEAPALLSEWLPIKITIKSNEIINKMCIQVKQIIVDNTNDPTTELSLTMNDKQNSVTIEINQIDKDNSIDQVVYVRSHQIGVRNFVIKADYIMSDEIKHVKEITYSLSIIKPFEVTTQFYTQLFEPLTKSFVNEPFILMPHVVCTSTWPIEIIDTSVELGNSIASNDVDTQKSLLKGIIMRDGESITDAYCVAPKAASEQPTSTGVYTLRWRRINTDNSGVETSTSVTLSPLWVEESVVGLDAKIPAHGWVRTPLCVSYFIKNYSDYLFTLRLTMEASDAFMYAGQKQIDICVRPKNEKKVEWILRPLVAGFVALPTLSLSVPPDEDHKLNKSKLIEVLERSLPTHIYIMPKSPVLET
ncbi:hypothetical protein PV327_007378 [Microctonus hyperodae]|uniref:Trafficking protein particle complex subunit 11 n=1 Tax=Microctonus hyperodae TaxID=165561 RepID=A0AA39FZT7_MICHY|nr:hypothetical protein PV327_007378 [Microctonus hyperodae]